MTLKKEHNIKFRSVNELVEQVTEISIHGRKAKVFTGTISVTLIENDEGENGNTIEYDLQSEDIIQENIDIIERIRTRGKKINKDALSELYKIGERVNEDWGHDKT
ncbi:hypothetical protein [Radiobacillus sp. PE A8.2]|uniref:hypothetical protein n=1 Tax=Radiobacillus sp. PE A8.2 TaxID=3380349 RepID=UPI00388F0330